ncbi:DUF4339 domain-containing protein [Massilia horti]|uniref:DUF4339 domain-containing protein n=1 Tax=Massilia horti TaxID=2562153 RepID=A0A4Y9STG3_9BURK|nr:DUF4339 domain-containing protein [Massilia horti]TFW28524.1 DUF4339 domain-containing protein [Massilia horti]
MDDNNFYSIDRLVEFGLCTAVARQMVESMNAALSQQAMPGYNKQVCAPGFWVVFDGKSAGPFDEAELLKLIMTARVTRASYVWKPGMAQWQTVENTPEVLRLVALTPPPFTS